MSKILNLYTIKQINNAYVLTIHEDGEPVETADASFTASVERLITHLTDKLNYAEEK